mgnify:CR=1 FL=1
MLMLMAGCGIIASLAEATGWGWLEALAVQTEHVEWEGFRFYDLIFPLFMFVSGVAIPYAIHSKIEKGVARSRLLRKILTRLVALVALGLGVMGCDEENPLKPAVFGVTIQVKTPAGDPVEEMRVYGVAHAEDEHPGQPLPRRAARGQELELSTSMVVRPGNSRKVSL